MREEARTTRCVRPPSQVRNLVNEGALVATARNGTAVEMRDFIVAYERKVLGAPSDMATARAAPARALWRTAVHEAGHALASWRLPCESPADRVTIVPRRAALGVTFVPHGDDYDGSGDAGLGCTRAWCDDGARRVRRLVVGFPARPVSLRRRLPNRR